ncbi:MAG: class I SAM-dependent methyltransferase [Pseudomonadota bacterium]
MKTEASLAQDLCAAIDRSRWNDAAQMVTSLKAQDPFAYSALRDTLAGLEIDVGMTRERGGWLKNLPFGRALGPRKAGKVLRARLDALKHWDREGNATIAALGDGTLDPASVKPHVRLSPEEYTAFYARQNAERAAGQEKRPLAPEPAEAARPDALRLRLSANFNHSVRKPYATTLLELVFGYVHALERPEEVSWIDIACGTGEIANGVDPGRFGPRRWQITGSDLQGAKIAYARSQSAKGRSFVAEDAFEMMQRRADGGEQYHIVSMFEFLEHIDDPLGFLKRVAEFKPLFVVAGSPLSQKLEAPTNINPDPRHLWSFSRESWETMFQAAGLEPVISSEVRVGRYMGGLDWLTMVSGPKDRIRARRDDLFGRKAARAAR